MHEAVDFGSASLHHRSAGVFSPCWRESKLTALVFDKTGAITEYKPQASDFTNLTRLSDHQLPQLAGAAEAPSGHFLGKAIVRYACELDLQWAQADDLRH